MASSIQRSMWEKGTMLTWELLHRLLSIVLAYINHSWRVNLCGLQISETSPSSKSSVWNKQSPAIKKELIIRFHLMTFFFSSQETPGRRKEKEKNRRGGISRYAVMILVEIVFTWHVYIMIWFANILSTLFCEMCFRCFQRVFSVHSTSSNQDPSNVQTTVVVLARHRPSLPQYMHSGRGTL